MFYKQPNSKIQGKTQYIQSKFPQMKYLAVWCFLFCVALIVVGAKTTEESYCKNQQDAG